MKLLVIYNQLAGLAYSNQKKFIERWLEQKNFNFKFHDFAIDGPLQSLNDYDFDKIICVGGDGTIREAVNWILKGGKNIPLAIIPKGSGNIIAQSLDIPFNINKSLEVAIEGQIRLIDVAQINHREYFILNAGIGLDAKMIKNTSAKLKRFVGIIAYIFGGLKSLFNIKPSKVFIKTNEMETVIKAQSVFISNVNRYLNMSISPVDSMQDGLFNVAIVRSVSLWDVLKVMSKLLAGDYKPDWRLQTFKTNKIYILPFDKHPVMQIDGELITLPYMDIEVIPMALSVIVPE